MGFQRFPVSGGAGPSAGLSPAFGRRVAGGEVSETLAASAGGGKTTIIAALMAYLRVCHEVRSFLLLSPNTIVRERLKTDFERPSRDDSVWRRFNLFPPEFAHYVHDMTLHVLQPGAGSAGIRSAAVTLGNIHQLYTSSTQGTENLGVILNHLGRIAVFNDEAHNTVAPKYDEILDLLSQSGKTVKRWERCRALKIPYTKADGRSGRYNPDFIVEREDGPKELHEVKGRHLLADADTQRKLAAGEEFCRNRKMLFKIITRRR